MVHPLVNRERAGDRGATTIPVAQYGPNVEWDAKQEKFEKEAIMPKAFFTSRWAFFLLLHSW